MRNESILKIQEKWKEGFVLGYDCVTFADGTIVMADTYQTYDPNNGVTKRYWSPLCDTTLEKIEKYNTDIWTACDVFHGSFEHENQRFVFGDGAMGNEGYVASTTRNGELNWSIFFTFSNPICKAKIVDHQLVCHGDTGLVLTVDLSNLTNIQIEESA